MSFRMPFAIFVLGTLSFVAALNLPRSSAGLQQPCATVQLALGSQQGIELCDGSLIQLNADTAFQPRVSARERRITLRQGEARFRVAKDPTRPFVVDTADARIMALGTIFNVRVVGDGWTAVTVLEGRVWVVGQSNRNAFPTDPRCATRNASRNEGLLLKAGQFASIEPCGEIKPLVGISPEQAERWPKHEVAFNEISVATVLSEINRYNTQPIYIMDERLSRHTISGVFNVYNPEPLLRYLEQKKGAIIKKSNDGHIILRTNNSN